MRLQSLGSAGQVEGIRVSVQQVLEGFQGGLAGLETRNTPFMPGSLIPTPSLSSALPTEKAIVTQAWFLSRPITKAPPRMCGLHVCAQTTDGADRTPHRWFPIGPACTPPTYRSYFAQQLLLSLAEQGLALNGCNGFWV